MRRKILSFILALTLMAGMGSIAYAENEWHGMVGSKKTPEISVYGEYEDGESTPKYCINIAWEDMTFNCTIEDNRIWNPNTHEYSGRYDLAIEGIVKDVTITNKSNARVKVQATAAQAEDPIQGVNLVLRGATTDGITEEFTLEDASISADIVHHLTVSLSETGDPNPDQFRGVNSNKRVVGTVTITVSDPNKEQSP